MPIYTSHLNIGFRLFSLSTYNLQHCHLIQTLEGDTYGLLFFILSNPHLKCSYRCRALNRYTLKLAVTSPAYGSSEFLSKLSSESDRHVSPKSEDLCLTAPDLLIVYQQKSLGQNLPVARTRRKKKHSVKILSNRFFG